MIRRALAVLVDTALNAYAPTAHLRAAHLFTDGRPDGADLLADREAAIETWEPGQPPAL